MAFLDESALISEVLAGDMRAARRLYDLHFPMVYRLAYRFAGDKDVAEDWTQEAFVRVFRHLRKFRREGPIAPWIRRITTMVALTHLKQERGHEPLTPDIVAGPSHSDSVDLPERMSTAISALPAVYRTAFVMYDILGYSHVEIAQWLEIPVGTSKARLARAREQLRASLGPDFGDLSNVS